MGIRHKQKPLHGHSGITVIRRNRRRGTIEYWRKVLWDTVVCSGRQVRSLQASGPGINTTPDHNSGPFDRVRQQRELTENAENHGAGGFILKGESFVVPPVVPLSLSQGSFILGCWRRRYFVQDPTSATKAWEERRVRSLSQTEIHPWTQHRRRQKKQEREHHPIGGIRRRKTEEKKKCRVPSQAKTIPRGQHSHRCQRM